MLVPQELTQYLCAGATRVNKVFVHWQEAGVLRCV